MPRELTDLFEQAVATAPPEPHHAADITRLAAHRQRRRTTGFVAAGAALAVAAVAGVTIGLTRGHPTRPEPAGGYRYDQHVDISDAVPASSLPDYRELTYPVPSVQKPGHGIVPFGTYQGVDAAGRLLVVRTNGRGDALSIVPHIYDRAGDRLPLRTPPSRTDGQGRRTAWLPGLYEQQRLLWRFVNGRSPVFHLTDMAGGSDQRFPVRRGNTEVLPSSNHDNVSDDHVWVLTYDHSIPKTGLTSNTLREAGFSSPLTKVAADVAVVDVHDGRAVWVTTDGKVFTARAEGGPSSPVPVPLDSGCRVSARLLQNLAGLAVSRSTIAVPETCGGGNQNAGPLLVFDLSGRLLARISGGLPFNVSFAGHSLVFQANESMLRYDLVSGSLARLNGPIKNRVLAPPSGNGDYVLWYDDAGGHVADIPQ